METDLSGVEIRVLGSLMEKEMATPEYYPLSINALAAACNQKSNREPVTDFSEETVEEAVRSLIAKQLAYEIRGARVKKYGQNFARRHNLLTREAAVLCMLMLRGPQTVGELKQRTSRMHRFVDLNEVQEALTSLADLDMAKNLGKSPGQKESRWTHLLGGVSPHKEKPVPEPLPVAASAQEGPDRDRIAALEQQVVELKEGLSSLRRELSELKTRSGDV